MRPSVLRFVAAWLGLSAVGSAILGYAMRDTETVEWLVAALAGTLVTAPLLRATVRWRAGHEGTVRRALVSLGCSWLVMVAVITAFCWVQAERLQGTTVVSDSGAVVHGPAGEVFRGLLLAVVAGTPMFWWAWIPMGWLWSVAAGYVAEE